jgi:D-alanine-D-alanine ligase
VDPTWRRCNLAQGLAFLQEHGGLVFPVMHGANGEDGTMQGMLQLAGLPFVGSDCAASALAMNKPRAKDVYRCAGLATPPGVWFTSADWRCDSFRILQDITALGIPCVVKTCRSGSSVGVSIVREPSGLLPILEELLPLSGDLLVEGFIKGREFTCGVIDDPREGLAPRALPIVEIRPRVSSWFDFKAKYQADGSDELCPAPIPRALAERFQEAGLLAHKYLGCRGLSRTDLIWNEPADRVEVIETNTIPGFTEASLLPKAAAAAGLDYEALVNLLVTAALSYAGGPGAGA